MKRLCPFIEWWHSLYRRCTSEHPPPAEIPEEPPLPPAVVRLVKPVGVVTTVPFVMSGVCDNFPPGGTFVLEVNNAEVFRIPDPGFTLGFSGAS